MKKILLSTLLITAVSILYAKSNGKETVESETKTISPNTNIVVYPNPAINGGSFGFDFSNNNYNEVIIVVVDIFGKEFYSKLLMMDQQNLKIGVDMENRIPSGVYKVIACSDNEIYNKSIVVENNFHYSFANNID